MRPGRRAVAAVSAAAALGAAWPAAAGASGIVAGPDGALWFVAGERIGRATTDGAIASVAAAGRGGDVAALAAGADGNLWFADRALGDVGRLTPAGTVTRFRLAGPGDPALVDLAAGPDGNVWLAADGGEPGGASRIGRVAPDGGVTWFADGLPRGAGLTAITAGSDGALWFTASRARRIGRMATDGSVTTFPAGAGGRPIAIAAGPDGALWFTLVPDGRARPAIGRITTGGEVTRFPLGARGFTAYDIAAGPDGNLWLTGLDRRVARVTTAGAVTVLGVGGEAEDPFRIAAGPDGNLWLREPGRIGRVTPSGVRSSFPPTAEVIAARRVRGGRAVRLTLRCPAGELTACRGRVLLAGPGARIAIVRRLALAPGRRRHAVAPLRPAWRRALARGRTVTLRSTVAPRPAPGSAPFPGGGSAVTRLHVLRS